MHWAKVSPSIVLMVLLTGLMLYLLPSLARGRYRYAKWRAVLGIVHQEHLPWSAMTNAEQAPYQQRAHPAGVRYAIYCALGQEAPVYVFLMVIIAQFSSATPKFLRKCLWGLYLCAWLGGSVFLSLAVALPQEIGGYQFPSSLVFGFLTLGVIAGFLAMLVAIFSPAAPDGTAPRSPPAPK